jgi:hypothetical protein
MLDLIADNSAALETQAWNTNLLKLAEITCINQLHHIRYPHAQHHRSRDHPLDGTAPSNAPSQVLQHDLPAPLMPCAVRLAMGD